MSSEPEFVCADLQVGDRVILASDGLWDVVVQHSRVVWALLTALQENHEAALIASYRQSATKCVQALMAAAKEKYQRHVRCDVSSCRFVSRGLPAFETRTSGQHHHRGSLRGSAWQSLVRHTPDARVPVTRSW